jgi:uncharacterized protein
MQSEDILNGLFYNPTRGNLRIGRVVDELCSYISEKPGKFYDIVVGCDSSSVEEPHFPLAVVILRVGEGGRFFLKKVIRKEKKFFNYKQRILEEVFLSCQLASYLKKKFDGKIIDLNKKGGHCQFRYIHADVGGNGATRDMIKEVTGLIKGNGFEAKIKPESFAASSVADRYS